MTSASVHTGSAPALTKFVGFTLTTKPEQAKKFYGETLGFRFLKDDGFALVFDAHGTMLRISKVKEFTPAAHTILGWEVQDIPAAVRDLTARGVVFERYPGMPQDAQGICTFPTGDRVAWFKDPDGNVLSLSQHKG
jgi:catechol 2,3-dioxygenase-like lactoylglutathione lyase family enzyme